MKLKQRTRLCSLEGKRKRKEKEKENLFEKLSTNRQRFFSSLTLSAHYVNNVFSQLRLDTFNSMNIMNFKCEGGEKERKREREREREREILYFWVSFMVGSLRDGRLRILMSPAFEPLCLWTLSIASFRFQSDATLGSNCCPPPRLFVFFVGRCSIRSFFRAISSKEWKRKHV